MIPRRILALGLAVALVHLNAVRAEGACATPGEAVAVETDAHDGHDAHAAEAGSDRRGHETGRDCDTQGLRDCCAAMASCAGTPAPEPGEQAATSLTRPGALTPGALVVTLKSRVAAPDPPPPRR